MNTPSAENIRRVLESASESDWDSGLTWYDSARDFASALTPDNVAMGAGIIAALSPMTSWPENVKKATMLVETGDTYGLSRNVDKAKAILSGLPPLDVLSGPKVRAFYMNIMGINSAEAVTIDRHAVDIALGRTMTNAERGPWMRGKRQASLVAMYLDVATEYTLTGAQVQAVTWVHWRRNYAQAFHGD